MKKKIPQNYLLAGMIFISMGFTSALQADQLSALRAGDLVPTQVGPVDWVTPLQNNSHEAVSFSWPVTNVLDSKLSRTPYVGKSRGYWMRVTDNELKKGINLDTSKPGILVKISPLDGGVGINPNQLEIDDNKGRRFQSTEALKQVVTAEKLATAGTPFPKGTSSFRLSAAHGMGRFILRAPNIKSSGKHYHVQVEEDGSDVVLNLKSDEASYLYGQNLRIHSRLFDSKGELQIQNLSGYLYSPAGKSVPLSFKRNGKGSFTASLVSLEAPATGTGLLEAHVVAQGLVNGVKVRRNVKTVFAYTVPQARFSGNVTPINLADKTLAAALDIEVGHAGRYEVRGVLYGKDRQGQQSPIMVSSTAAWLEAGKGSLNLKFDNTLLSASGLTRPYEVRDLQLLDQSRMGMLHYQRRGFPF